MVDWGPLSGFPYYAAAAKNTRVVGPHVAQFLIFLDNLGAVSIHHVHLIGFSLGAEVSGFAGKTLGPGVLPRITGTPVEVQNRFGGTVWVGRYTIVKKIFVGLEHREFRSRISVLDFLHGHCESH